ncbi:MAG TPA: M48 family metallopeptidase [Gemmatimonadaceae bacterium]|nr:M48 family metallopeptidase [Gemmatimonadaceae bacterium]
MFTRRIALTVGVTLLVAGCASAGAVSTQQEVQLGAQEAQQVDAQLPMLNDAQIDQYVNTLGNEIASRTSRSDLQWHFAVVNTSDVNAFALPGGYIYVNRGVLERASNASELAGVLGHEIEHVVRRHSVKQMAQMQNANIGVALGCALARVCDSPAAQAAVNVAGGAYFAKNSRADEVQADEGGFQNVVRAGLNPTGMLTFFQKLLQEEQASGGAGRSGVSSWFADHPGTSDRIADIQRMLGQVPQSQLSSLTTDTPAYDRIHQRVLALPPAPAPKQTSGQ